jgi:hypothetical protein
MNALRFNRSRFLMRIDFQRVINRLSHSSSTDEYRYVGLAEVIGNRANGQFPQTDYRQLQTEGTQFHRRLCI